MQPSLVDAVSLACEVGLRVADVLQDRIDDSFTCLLLLLVEVRLCLLSQVLYQLKLLEQAVENLAHGLCVPVVEVDTFKVLDPHLLW